MKVAAFTQGRNIPSTRFRLRQYIPLLQQVGIEVTEFSALFGAYPPRATLLRPPWAMATLASRLPALLRSYRYDVTFLQRELLSTTVTLEPLLHCPRILDVDDAIWAHPRGRFAAHLAQQCDSVICGNRFLAEYFSEWNHNITIIPTGVDTIRFHPRQTTVADETVIIGWSGTSANFDYLLTIEPALKHLLQTEPTLHFRVVADMPPKLTALPPHQYEFIRWTPETETIAIQGMDIGIMPLADTIFARGKCSYKMLLYMACALPVVVSPVGMNREVLALDTVGYSATSLDEWIDGLRKLAQDSSLRQRMGNAGRRIAEQYFSLPVITAQLVQHMYTYA